MKIDNIQITADTIRNAIEYNYPNTLSIIEDNELYYYMALFGIRVSTCDTGIPDDILGAIRFVPNAFSSGGKWEMIVTEGTTDPSPYYSGGKGKGGKFIKGRKIDKTISATAWVKEGQYVYTRSRLYDGYPSFRPVGNIKVYRWMAKYDGDIFNPNAAILSESSDTLIHRSWSSDRFYNDSAGCQVLKNNALLWDLDNWAKKHNSQKNYPKQYTYTLLLKNQFVNANSSTNSNEFSIWNSIFK